MDQDHPYSLNEDAIEGILKFVCRKKGLRDDRADEFCQWTRLKLIENDCAILRSFKGNSTFKTFLSTVILNKYRDWLDYEQGKFRVTVDAKELGPVAVNLELLVLRDKVPYEEAVQLLISKGVAVSVKDCDEIWGQLKRAPRRDFLSEDALGDHKAAPDVDPVEHEEHLRLIQKAHAVLHDAIAALPPSDGLILKLKYWSEVSVACIAKTQLTEQKPLYRRFERLLKRLETDLLARGLTEEEIRELFDEVGIDPSEFGDGVGNDEIGPSTHVNAGGMP